jgi:hypothetical protein
MISLIENRELINKSMNQYAIWRIFLRLILDQLINMLIFYEKNNAKRESSSLLWVSEIIAILERNYQNKQDYSQPVCVMHAGERGGDQERILALVEGRDAIEFPRSGEELGT